MTLIINTCKQCGWQWAQHRTRKVNPIPLTCPNCQSHLWNRDSKIIHGENYTKAIEIRQSNPCATLQTIGDKLGVSRERVRQILNKAHKPTKHYIVTYHCNGCGKEILKNNVGGYCMSCKILRNKIPVACTQCEKIFYLSPSRLLVSREHYFCSNKCKGKWMGIHYGRGHHKLALTTV